MGNNGRRPYDDHLSFFIERVKARGGVKLGVQTACANLGAQSHLEYSQDYMSKVTNSFQKVTLALVCAACDIATGCVRSMKE